MQVYGKNGINALFLPSLYTHEKKTQKGGRMRKHNMKKFSNKLSGEEERIFAHLLKQDGIEGENHVHP